MPATVNIYFDNRMSKEGEWYAKYAVYFEKTQRYFATGIKLDSEDVEFLKKYKSGLTGGVRDEYRRTLWNTVYGKEGLLEKAEQIVSDLGSRFTFAKFQENIKSQSPSASTFQDIFADLEARASQMAKDGDLSNESICKSARQSLIRFTKKTTLPYDDLTKEFLNKYEKWMLREGKAPQPKKDKDGNIIKRNGTPASNTTISMYLRQIRTVFLQAIIKHPSLATSYPFIRESYVIPASKNIKKAIKIEDIEKIIAYQPLNQTERRYRDLWLFSYLSNGINFLDMLNLKWSNLDEKKQTIEFTRSKTQKTKKSKLTKVQIDLFPISIEIIDTWGDRTNSYIFPVFRDGMDEQEKRAAKFGLIKYTNKYMRRIAIDLGIPSDITTYTARHTFATILLRSEVPLAFISQKLSHESIKTTQDYLGSFEDDQSKKYLSALLPKKKG